MVVSFIIKLMFFFHRKLGSIQHYAALAIIAAIQVTLKEKLCQEFGFQSLEEIRWYIKFYYFHKIF